MKVACTRNLFLKIIWRPDLQASRKGIILHDTAGPHTESSMIDILVKVEIIILFLFKCF
jgi:hypothetical protein